MAPNVKQLHALASSLADINVVQAKYLPLTHQTTVQQQEETSAPSVPVRSPAQIAESDSYWSWTADVPVAVAEEQLEQPALPNKDLFSAAAIEANLIRDSQRPAAKELVVAADAADHDDYWAEASSSSSSVDQTKPQHDDYWYAPANPEEAHIQAILNEEFARQQVSLATIERNLLAARSQSRASGQKASNDDYWAEETVVPAIDSSLQETYSQNYWVWESDSCGKANNITESILAEEKCRQAVSLARIEHNLKSTVLPPCGQTKAACDDMWNWSHDAHPSDRYWDTSLPKAVGHHAGYWDM